MGRPSATVCAHAFEVLYNKHFYPQLERNSLAAISWKEHWKSYKDLKVEDAADRFAVIQTRNLEEQVSPSWARWPYTPGPSPPPILSLYRLTGTMWRHLYVCFQCRVCNAFHTRND